MSRSTRRWLTLIAASLALTLFSACQGTDGQADSNDSDEEAQPSGARVEVSLSPQKFVYPTGLPITPSATVYNENDEVVEDAQVKWTLEPSDGAENRSGNKYTPTAEGELTFRACRVTDGSAGDLCGIKTIVVDAGKPDLQVQKPQRGAFFGMNGNETVEVAGSVSDSYGTTSVFINGTEVQVSDDGSFSYNYEPEFGPNHIQVRANDGLHDTDEVVRRDIMYAPHYKPADVGNSQVGFMTTGGIVLDLGQNFFDDTEPPQTEDGSTLVTNDFADIAELLVQNIDLGSQIPNPAIDTSAVTLNIPDVQVGTPDVAVDITDRGLDLYIFAENVTVTTGGELEFQGETLNLTGTVDAQLSAALVMSLDKPSANDPFEASIDDLHVSLDRVESNFADAQADALFALAESTLRSKLESIVVGEIEDRFLSEIPTLITDTLNSIDDTISEQTFTFQNDLIGTRTFTLSGQVGDFSSTFRDAVHVGIDGTGQTSGDPMHADAPGIPRMTPAGTTPPLFDQSRLQMGVDLGVLNGALYALWKAGFLDINITELLPDSVKAVAESGQFEGKLPPVLVPADKTSEYDLLLRLGQAEVDAQLLDQRDRVAATIEVGIDVSFDDSKLTLDISDSPEIKSWLIETTGNTPILTKSLFRSAFKNQIWPRIGSALEGGLEVDVPLPDLSAVSDISPTLSDLQLDIVQARPLDIRRGYLILDSTLEGRLSLGGDG